MLRQQEVETFIQGVTRYFAVSTAQPAKLGSPYLAMQTPPGAYDFTGVIEISGARQGRVYFTATRGMLSVLLMCLNETEITTETMADVVGEVANTIAGNARADFGRSFEISTPRVLSNASESASPPPGGSAVVIPINWRSHTAKLIVSLS
jgi:chemotaxis protein CheX